MHIVCATPETGVLVPIPQYPLYTATLALLNARCVPYYLDESKAWGTDMDAITLALEQARSEGTDVRAIVVINPGNPTGASLSEDDVKGVIDLAASERLVIMADEVYQTNVFEEEAFTPLKRVYVSCSELSQRNTVTSNWRHYTASPKGWWANAVNVVGILSSLASAPRWRRRSTNLSASAYVRPCPGSARWS